MLYFWGRNRDL